MSASAQDVPGAAVHLHARRQLSSDDVSLLDTPRPEAKPHETQSGYPFLRVLERIDQELSFPLHRAAPGPLVDAVMLFPALWFSAFVVPWSLLACFLFAPARFFLLAMCGTLLTLAVSNGCKVAIGRLRPGAHIMGHRIVDLRVRERNHAMPSGDTAQAAMWCTLFYCYYYTTSVDPSTLPFFAPHTPWFFLLVPLTAAGRVYYCCHWWGDTVGGATLGASAALAVWSVSTALCSQYPAFLGDYCKLHKR